MTSSIASSLPLESSNSMAINDSSMSTAWGGGSPEIFCDKGLATPVLLLHLVRHSRSLFLAQLRCNSNGRFLLLDSSFAFGLLHPGEKRCIPVSHPKTSRLVPGQELRLLVFR